VHASGTVARAFELARGGTCQNVDDVRRLLAREGHSAIHAHLSGARLKKQLAVLIKASRSELA
jgi:hypothetical protein